MTRFFDILLSGLALLVFSPLLVPLAIVLRLTGEGEIFFRAKNALVGVENYSGSTNLLLC